MKPIEKQLDELWSRCIKLNKNCSKCGKTGHDPHHIFGRRKCSTRWDIENGILLCRTCHNYAHANPKAFMTWIDDRSDLSKLRIKANTPAKIDHEEKKKELIGYIKKQASEYVMKNMKDLFIRLSDR